MGMQRWVGSAFVEIRYVSRHRAMCVCLCLCWGGLPIMSPNPSGVLGERSRAFQHGPSTSEEVEAEAKAAAENLAAAEAALKAARQRAQVTAARARAAKAKSRAAKSSSPPDKRQHSETAVHRAGTARQHSEAATQRAGTARHDGHVRRPRAPEPNLLLQQPPGLEARVDSSGAWHPPVKKLAPLRKSKAHTSRARSGRTPRERTGRTPRENQLAQHNEEAGGSSSNLGDPKNEGKLFLTLTPRSTDTTTSTKTTASWREREQAMAGLSNQTGTNWWEAPPPPQHKRLVFPGEGIYAGVVVGKGVRDGYGKMWFVDGLVYEGQWVANAMQGSGIMSYETGAVYDGEFDHNVRHGTGTLTYANSDVYSGGWAEDNKEGYGVFTFHSDGGSKYEGQWVAGVMDGQGTYTFADGCKYVGGYQDGRRHGKGIFVNEDGTEDAGEWSHGRRVDRTRQMFATQVGSWSDGEGGSSPERPTPQQQASGGKQRRARTTRTKSSAAGSLGTE